MEYTQRDLQYIEASYVPLQRALADAIERGVLPRPSYVLADGTAMVPRDYFGLVDVRPAFEERFLAAGGDPATLEDEWEGYLSGLYGVCLRDVTPETIVRKTALVESLSRLLADPRTDDPDWRERLRAEVDELDELERQFAPDYDRDLRRFGKPPTRDTLIAEPRGRFPDVFTRSAA